MVNRGFSDAEPDSAWDADYPQEEADDNEDLYSKSSITLGPSFCRKTKVEMQTEMIEVRAVLVGSWIVSPILKIRIAYSSDVTPAILLSEQSQLPNRFCCVRLLELYLLLELVEGENELNRVF
ncbi:hypothetical protein L6164_011977 [Bauhinia variegata]|uniref:Uncharacterized protein n=1 Tax=Bauhinia variegata TaxID=167791 RepID=A0ACB9P8N8_BAUVA|nr:hypothetical protein L6164_011977 [Bauhinia variegata]